MPTSDPNITVMVETFAIQITAAVEAAMADRIQAALPGVLGIPQKRGSGRPPKQAKASVAARSVGKKTRPKQFCPVPGCKNVAAPIFGMVCKDHKNVAKSKIKKYRAERKGKVTSLSSTAKPAGTAKPAAAKKTRTATPKAIRARKLQGQYMGALKSLKGADRAKVKAVAKEKGVAAAVKIAAGLKAKK